MIDIIFLVIIGLYAFVGLLNGLMSAALSIFSRVAALFLAIAFAPRLYVLVGFLAVYWHFILIFAVVLGLIGLFRAKALHKTDEKISVLDHCLGCVIGSMDGVLVCGLITYLMLTFPFKDLSGFFQNARVAEIFSYYVYEAKQVIGF